MSIFRNDSGYAPLQVNLSGYWEKSFVELPAELKAIVGDAFSLFPWDSLTISGRQSNAAQLDYQHDPKLEPAVYFALFCFAKELPRWIEKARDEGKDASVVALRDVEDRIKAILDTDRARVGAEIQKLRALQVDRDTAADPDGRNHVSDKLAKTNQAAQKYWGNADPNDRGTHPDNATVAAWLVTKGFSETLADRAATIIRPDWGTVGRKPGE